MLVINLNKLNKSLSFKSKFSKLSKYIYFYSKTSTEKEIFCKAQKNQKHSFKGVRKGTCSAKFQIFPGKRAW